MNHIYNRLNKLSKNQLLEICKILNISCSKKKRHIILKLLQPIHTYRMDDKKVERAAKRKKRAEEREKKSRELKLLREQKRKERDIKKVERSVKR